MTQPMQTVSNRAVLSFKDNDGFVGTVSIPRARLDKGRDEFVDSMTAMIESGALMLSNNLIPSDFYRAKLISTDRTRIV